MSSYLSDPQNVNLTSPLVSARDVTCYLQAGSVSYNGRLGERIASVFVLLVTSTFVCMFPVLCVRSPKLKIPIWVYIFARYFGTGVITATAFVHLLDPAYSEIGPQTCVGMTGNWVQYSWVPAIALTACMLTFLIDFVSDVYIEKKYGKVTNADVMEAITRADPQHQGEVHANTDSRDSSACCDATDKKIGKDVDLRTRFVQSDESIDEDTRQMSIRQQFSAFLILEFGVIFHSVMIGLNLGVCSTSDFATLFPVLVFHQAFEGLGIGVRLSTIPFHKKSLVPWLLCLAYGLTTPISVSIGLGVRNTYDSSSFNANIISGVLDSISAGILLYTGLVELIARDFMFDPNRTTNTKHLTFMVIFLFLGAGIMALVGKWA